MVVLDFTTLVRNQVAAIQAMASSVVDFAIGSILRAIVESNASLVVYLSGLVLELLVTTRAATCSGDTLDTWMADYSVTRIPATYATGNVTFARFTPAQSALVLVGTTVETADGSQTYMVATDTNHPNYLPVSSGYMIPAGVSSIVIPVVAVTAGANGNAAIGSVNTLTQTVVGVDTVSNAAVFVGGADAETDDALRTRFVAYIASLARATKGSIAYAIKSVKDGIQYAIVENENYDGTPNKGYFYTVVDDGTGSPTSTLLNSVGSAIDAVRPLCSTFGVFAPIIVYANVIMTVEVAAGADPVATKATVKDAVTNYINSTGLNGTLPYTMLPRIAYNASSDVVNVSGITLNGSTADLAATALQTIKSGTIAVN